MIEELINTIPSNLLGRSGAVFYSGVDAFSGERDLYILGLNPGGSPERQANETLATNLQSILEKFFPNWSAYSDDSWQGSKPGARGLQPRILHFVGPGPLALLTWLELLQGFFAGKSAKIFAQKAAQFMAVNQAGVF